MSDATVTVTDASFDDEVLKAAGPVVVDFWAKWCGPCRMIAPVLEDIAVEQAGKLVVAKLDVDENPATAEAYQVRSIPFMGVFSGGKLVKAIVGAQPKAAILEQLEEFLR